MGAEDSGFCRAMLACRTPPLPNEFITAADEGWVAMCAYLSFLHTVLAMCAYLGFLNTL